MILIDVEVVCIQEIHDFLLDEHLTAKRAAAEMARILRNLRREEDLELDFLLCSEEENGPIAQNKTLQECGIKSGSHLILV